MDISPISTQKLLLDGLLLRDMSTLLSSTLLAVVNGFLLSLGSNLLGLHTVDSLDQVSLGLESVTLGEEVELVVDVLVDLLGLSVLLEKTTKDSHSSHPEDLERKTSILGTSSLTMTYLMCV